MAASLGMSGKGTTLGHSTTSNGTYTFFAEVKDMNASGITIQFEEATHYTSDNGFTEMINTGWKTATPVTFTVNYDKATTATTYALIGTKKFFKQLLPDGGNWIFEGTISGFGNHPVPNKGIITNTITIQPAGATVFSAS